MQTFRDKHRDSGLVYDQNLKKALEKTKKIEKRIQERSSNLKKRWSDFKSLCRLIRFQQTKTQSPSPELPSLESKVFPKSSDESIDHERDDQQAKCENVKISKTQAKVESVSVKTNKEAKKQAKIEFLIPESRQSRDIEEAEPTVLQDNIQVKKEYESEKVNMSAAQRSEHSTAKFVDSQRQSSFLLKSPFAGEQQSFTGQNQEFQKMKNTGSFQSTVQEKIQPNKKSPFGTVLPEVLTQNISFFNPQIFSFSVIPQPQIVNIETNLTPQIHPGVKSEKKCQDKENVSVENFILQTNGQQISPKKQMNSQKIPNEVVYQVKSKSLDKSLMQSGDQKSLSFFHIYDQLDKCLKVNSPQSTPVKETQTLQIISQLPKHPQKQEIIESKTQPKNDVYTEKVDLAKLEINPSFQFNNGKAQVQKVLPRTRNKLFKKGRKLNSSDENSQ